MCEEEKLKLIPVVILIAALIAGLLLAFPCTSFIPVYVLGFCSALMILLLTAVGILICGLLGGGPDFEEGRRERLRVTCSALRCFGPVILLAAAGTMIISTIALGTIFPIAFAPILAIIIGSLAALLSTITLVYFIGMICFILDRLHRC